MTTDTGASVGVVAVAVAVAKGTGVKAVVVTGVLRWSSNKRCRGRCRCHGDRGWSRSWRDSGVDRRDEHMYWYRNAVPLVESFPPPDGLLYYVSPERSNVGH